MATAVETAQVRSVEHTVGVLGRQFAVCVQMSVCKRDEQFAHPCMRTLVGHRASEKERWLAVPCTRSDRVS